MTLPREAATPALALSTPVSRPSPPEPFCSPHTTHIVSHVHIPLHHTVEDVSYAHLDDAALTRRMYKKDPWIDLSDISTTDMVIFRPGVSCNLATAGRGATQRPRRNVM